MNATPENTIVWVPSDQGRFRRTSTAPSVVAQPEAIVGALVKHLPGGKHELPPGIEVAFGVRSPGVI